MAFSPRLYALAFAAPLALSAPAFADTTGDMIDQCVAEMETVSATAFTDASYKFKRISGSSTKKLAFEMTSSDMSETVTCKVRRGAISEIEWPELVLASLNAETELADNT